MDTINLVLAAFSALVGFPSLIAALGNFLKVLKVLPDGAANAYNFWANVLVFVGVGFAVFTGKTDVLSWLDTAAGGVAKIIAEVIVLMGGSFASMIMAKKWHSGLRGLPLIGKSHSE